MEYTLALASGASERCRAEDARPFAEAGALDAERVAGQDGGARHEAERLGVPFLGEVPLDMDIRERSDAGMPVVATAPNGAHAEVFRGIAARVRDQIATVAGRAAPDCSRFSAKRIRV